MKETKELKNYNKSDENNANKSNNNQDMTIEQLLIKLREQKNWTYLELMEELNKKGIILKEKDLKKWEWGLEYPNLDIIYKLSEIYMVPSEDFVNAKNNSYTQGLNKVHIKFINWICYLTEMSFKFTYMLMWLFIFFGLAYAFWFFMDKVDYFFSVT